MERQESLSGFGQPSAVTSGIKPVGQAVSEMRIHAGPGYRVYFTRTGMVVYVLLYGGIKRGQERDIAKAQEMARTLSERVEE